MNGAELKKSILYYALQGKFKISKSNDSGLNYLKTCSSISGIKHSKIENPPFKIPSNWEWAFLPEIAEFKLGKTPVRSEPQWWNGDIKWFSIADMKDNEVIVNSKETITKKALNDLFNNSISPKGTLLMSFKLTVGKTSILGVDGVHNEAIISIFPYIKKENITRDYLSVALNTIVLFADKTNAIKGKTLNKTKLNQLMIPIPPLDEQKRIVEKIKKIKPLVEEYEKLERERDQISM